MRDGAARGRRPVLRRARDEGVRRRVRARPARRRAHRLPPGLARRCSGRGRTSTRRSSRSGGAPLPAASPSVKRVVEAAFAHRRKTLAELARARRRRVARARRPRRSRRSARSATTRAEALEPDEFVALAEALRVSERARAARRSTSRSSSGRVRADGKHEVATVLQRVDLADRIALEPARRARRRGLRRRTRSSGARSSARREPPGSSRAGASGSRSGSRSPPGSAAAAPTPPTALRLANATLDRAARPASGCTSSRRALGADVPFFLEPRARSSARATARRSSRLELPQDFIVLLLLPDGASEGVDRRRSTPRSTTASGGDGFDERRARCSRALATRARDLAALPPNDLASLAARGRAARRSARSAPTSAAPGPTVYGLFHDERGAEAAARRSSSAAAGSGSCAPAWYG